MPFKNFNKSEPRPRTQEDIAKILKAVCQHDCRDCKNRKRCNAKDKIVDHPGTANNLDIEFIAPRGYCKFRR